ncbi:MAG: SPFH domain-containing protein [Anaerolineae bacterium]|jgi:regulator of protease activity HflC (stomatin/prohibitin superfamily)
MTEQTEIESLPIDYAQLSQVRVPLERAGDVFSQKDARGRTPVVLVPLNPHRVQNAFVIAGLIILVAGFVAGTLLGQWAWPSLGSVLGVGLIVFGVYRSFLVRIPEGSTALLSRAGRYVRTLEAGSQVVPPWFAISHLVTQREIPYDVPAVEALTKDNVRAAVDTLITFTISDPYHFVFSITADDFDEILLAACLDAIRGAVRRLPAEKIADLTRQETAKLRETLNAEVEPYGVTVNKINVTDARPPAEFLRSQESRQLAVFQRAEQAEKQALAQRLQTDAEALARQQAIAQVEREREEMQSQVQQAEMRRQLAELEAEAEELRLSTLEKRLQNYPQAAQYELKRAQLEIARALAGNTRAVLQIGAADDILRAYVMREFLHQEAGSGDSPLLERDNEGGTKA